MKNRLPRDWFKTETDYVKFMNLKKGKQSIDIMDIASSYTERDPWYNPCTFIDGIDVNKLDGKKYGKIKIENGTTKYPHISLAHLVSQEYKQGNTTFYCNYQDFDIIKPQGLFEMAQISFGTLVCDFKFSKDADITRLFSHTGSGKAIYANFNDIEVNNSTTYVFDRHPDTVYFYNFPGCNKTNWLGNKTQLFISGLRLSTNLQNQNFTTEQLHYLIEHMQTVSTTQTLTLGETQMARLTAEDIKIATDKGWTLA